MSQAGSLFVNAPIGAGILTVTSNNGIPVGPTILGDIQIVGGGDITVTGDPFTNTLTITSVAAATNFHTDDGNNSTALAGTLTLTGTVNQIQTLSIPAGGPYHTVQFALTNDVIIPGNFQATNIFATTNLGCVTFAAAGNSSVGGNLDVTGQIVSATGDIIAVAGDIYGIRGVFTGDVFGANLNTPGTINANNNGIFGGTVTANNVTIGTNLTLPATPTSGVLFKASGGVVSSSPGTINGQVIICDVANGPAWALLQAGNGIGIVNAPAHSVTIGLTNNIVLPGTFQATTITATGLVTAQAGLTVSGGNVSITGGILSVTNNIITQNLFASGLISATSTVQGVVSNAGLGVAAFSTINGNITTTNGQIRTVYGELAGDRLTINTTATINSLNIPGVLSNTAAGLIQSSNGANGQLMIGGGAGPTWANLTAGAGIAIANGPNSIMITNTGAGAIKSAFNIGLTGDLTSITGDGTTIVFTSALGLAPLYDTTASFNLATGRFTALVNGIYQFMMQINYTINPIYSPDGWNSTFYIYTTSRNFTCANPLDSSTSATPNFSGQYLINTYLAAGQQARFGFRCTNYNAPAIKICTINNLNTFLTGFQIS